MKNSSKQTVLHAIEILEKYDDIYAADPNYSIELSNNISENLTTYETGISTMAMQIPFTEAQLILERDANQYTLSCCAKKYTDSTKNYKSKIGIVGFGIDSSSEASLKIAEFVDCTEDNLETYRAPFDPHTTHVANVTAREQVSTMSYVHSSCNNNTCSGTCDNVDLYSLNVVNQNGESSVDYFIKAIEYAVSNNIKILSFSDLLAQNIRYITFETAISNYNGIVIASASNIGDAAFSNNNLDLATEYTYPTVCDSDNVVVVGNSTYVNGIPEAYSTSRYGQNTVDLFAPGYTFATFGYDTGSKQAPLFLRRE